MKKNVFLKVFFSSVVWTAACLGLAAYAANKASQQDPEILSKVAEKVQATSNMKISFHGSNDQDFTPAEDTWTFPSPTEKIDLSSINRDVEIFSTKAGSPLLVSAKGFRHKSQPKLLETVATKTVVSLVQPDNDSTRKLKIRVSIPEDFKGKLSIKTVSGDTELKALSLNSLEVNSVSGTVGIEKSALKEATLKTVSGDVHLENKIRGRLNLESVSGDYSLRLADAGKTNFQLESLSGTIKNSWTPDPKGETTVRVKTASGDIEIY
jgi:hypothetical protein